MELFKQVLTVSLLYDVRERKICSPDRAQLTNYNLPSTLIYSGQRQARATNIKLGDNSTLSLNM